MTALGTGQGDVPAGLMPFEAFHGVTQPVTAGIEIGVVDLLGIAGEDHFGPLSSPADDGFKPRAESDSAPRQ